MGSPRNRVAVKLMYLSSQPYRPPDPAALPPMPFGLPFIARPGQEGFDQYGRMSKLSIPTYISRRWAVS